MKYLAVILAIILLTACAASPTPASTFYEKASAAVNAGKIQFDKFNALFGKANRHGYAALEELQPVGGFFVFLCKLHNF